MGPLTFVQPRYLLLLLLLIPLWSIAFLTRSARGPRVAAWRVWSGLALRTVILAALVLALAGIQLVRPASSMTTVFVLDSSDSISPAARARGEAYIQDALRRMPEGDQAAVVVFGSDALVERPPSGDRELVRLRLAPDATATDIARALRLGLATLPAGTNRRVILLSDGAETRQASGASALEVAAEAGALGVPVETVSLAGPPAAGDAVVETIEAPATARDGQNVRLVVQVRSNPTEPSSTVNARLRLLRNRELVLDTTVELAPGVNRIPLTAVAPRGFHTWEARIEALGDSVGANNVAFGFTEVRGPPRILLVEGAPGRAANLQAAMEAARLETEIVAPAGLPQSLPALDVYDAVVLVDAPYRALPSAATKLLPAYVRELGHGLLMVGGEDSYAAGGYGDTPIETLLPVSMRTRGVNIQPDVALVLVIDRSGSMSGEKLELAKEGVAQAFLALQDEDQVGLIAFDTDATWIVDLQRKPPIDQVLGSIGSVSIGGGTDLRPGLDQATTALEKVDAKIKHILLLTDGQADSNYEDVVERIKAQGITLSTVGVGDGYDANLRLIAPETGGRFYEALNFNDVPRIFFDETIRIARRGIVEETFTPLLGSPLGAASTLVRDLRETPPLHGYNAVTPRDTAQVVLAAPNGDPILAQWQYGLGRSAAWTSDMKGQWARDWVAWNGFGRFAAGLVETLLTPPIAEGYEASTTIAGAGLALDLRVDPAAQGAGSTGRPYGRLLAAGGEAVDVPLIEREPGRYRGTIPLPPAGVYRVQVVAPDADGTENILATTGAVVPPSAEYLQPEGNPGLLKAIADGAGGRIDFPAADAFARPAQRARRASGVIWPLLWMAVLLWPLDIAVRRLLLPGIHFPGLQGVRRRLDTWRSTSTAKSAPARHAEALARARRREQPPTSSNLGPTPSRSIPTSGTFAVPATSKEGERGPPPSDEPRATPAASRPDWRSARRSLPERPSKRDRG